MSETVSSEPVSYDRTDRIACILIQNPPVNALSQVVRAGLLAAIERFLGDEQVDIAVIAGGGRLFLGGADIGEFGKPQQAPGLPDVINAIEACTKPVVAAIHGAALGGGLEVAMGAHYRIAQRAATLGLPEVKLGLLPGAGGTQRLPRLIGIDAALSMITTGKPVTADDALEQGLIDRVDAGADIVAAGVAYARELLQQNAEVRRSGTLARASTEGGSLPRWRVSLQRSARGEVAALSALQAVEASTQLDLVEGLAEERRLFNGLMATPQRAGLIHAFFAERKVTKLPSLVGVEPFTVERIGVVGGGTMGAGIATAVLLAGLPLTLVERDPAAVDKARATIAGYLAAAVKRGKLDDAGRTRLLDLALLTTTDMTALGDVDLIIEAVFESMDVKTAVFEQLDGVAKHGAILATNTSYLDIDQIAAVTGRPESVIGLHFFSPAHVMKLLEVVVADRTAPPIVATAFALAKRLGKTAVRAGVCDGFIGNRMLSHYRSVADHLVLDGASPYQVDRALTDFGFAMGPYAVADLAGLDIGHATRKRRASMRHPQDRYPAWADALFELGRLGQKTGRGYYLYPQGSRRGEPDPELGALIDQARADAGIVAHTIADEDIVRRYMAAMVNEGARVLDEGIARRPLDIDVVLLYGYGFPRWRGGPMHWADQQGLASILVDINEFAATDDHFWRPAPLLERLVAGGRDFDSLNNA